MKKILFTSLLVTIILSGCLKAPEKTASNNPVEKNSDSNVQQTVQGETVAPLSGENVYDPSRQTRVFYSPSDLEQPADSTTDISTSNSNTNQTEFPSENVVTSTSENTVFHRSESFFPITSDQLKANTKENPAPSPEISTPTADSSQKP